MKMWIGIRTSLVNISVLAISILAYTIENLTRAPANDCIGLVDLHLRFFETEGEFEAEDFFRLGGGCFLGHEESWKPNL